MTDKFAIGDVVEVIGPKMTGVVGVYIWKDEKRNRCLVRISDVSQLYFSPDELRPYRRRRSAGP